MTEFDEMLNQVLCEDARVEVPADLESRIALTLSNEKKARLDRQKVRLEAIAATLLLGLAGMWAHKSLRPAVSTTATMADSTTEQGSKEINSANLLFPSHALALARKPTLDGPPTLQLDRKSLRLAPVVIEPLVLEPIEIASLVSRTSTEIGEIR